MAAGRPLSVARPRQFKGQLFPLCGHWSNGRNWSGATITRTSRKQTLKIWGFLPVTGYGRTGEFTLSANSGRWLLRFDVRKQTPKNDKPAEAGLCLVCR